MKLGIQLYTVRDACKQNFEGTIDALVGMGYPGVEFAWEYGALTPDELARFLDDRSVVACGWHAPIDDLLDGDSDTYAYARAVRTPFISVSLAHEVAHDWDRAIGLVRDAGATARELGLTLTYHNHVQEFDKIDGACALDLLYAATDPNVVQAQLDTHYIKRGGLDPASYIRSHANRVRQVHLKDLHRNRISHTEVGSGILDIPGIWQAALECNVPWIIVEQEADFINGSSLDSARVSFDYLRSTP